MVQSSTGTQLHFKGNWIEPIDLISVSAFITFNSNVTCCFFVINSDISKWKLLLHHFFSALNWLDYKEEKLWLLNQKHMYYIIFCCHLLVDNCHYTQRALCTSLLRNAIHNSQWIFVHWQSDTFFLDELLVLTILVMKGLTIHHCFLTEIPVLQQQSEWSTWAGGFLSKLGCSPSVTPGFGACKNFPQNLETWTRLLPSPRIWATERPSGLNGVKWTRKDCNMLRGRGFIEVGEWVGSPCLAAPGMALGLGKGQLSFGDH